ncbi:MAG: invasin domain 3-containing protein, partial [Gemmatimonadales bacterium]
MSWSASQGTLSEAAPVTDASGRVSAAWTLGSQAGTQSVQVTSAGLSGSPVTFTATATSGPPPQLALSTQPGATATSGIPIGPQPVVQLQDASGAPVQQGGVLVTAGITSGGGTLLGNTSVNTNSGGQAAFTDLAIAGSPGDRTLTFGASGHISVTSNPITVTAGTPDLGASSLSASPTTILASSGSAISTLTVVARDAQDNVVPGVAVSFSVTGGGVTVTQPAGPTNSSGVATGTLSSAAAGPKTVSAALNGAGIGQTVVITVAPSNASARHSTATVPDGSMGHPTVIDIQLRDQFSNPLKAGGDNVVVSVTGANSASASVTDNNDGSYTATYTPAVSGTDDIAISVNGSALGGSPFKSDVTSAVSATQSTVSVSPGSITASSGSANAVITVTARDGSGAPVGGVSVNVSATGSSNSLTQPSGPTNSQGVATATLSSTAAEVKTISASAAGISLSQTVSVTVQAGPPSPQTTQVSTPGGKRAQIIPILITTYDQFDNPLTVGGYGAQISVRVTGTNAWGNLNVNDLGDGTY